MPKQAATSIENSNAKGPSGEVHAAQKGVAPTVTAAVSVDTFCKAHSISRSMFYKLQRQGKGPRLTKIGKRTLVSSSAAAEWLKQMEYQGGPDDLTMDIR